MTDEELNIAFEDAVKRINKHQDPYPADLLLRLYAYYKKATNNYERPSSKEQIINAFKTNALFQIQSVDSNEAKIAYIELVDNYFLYRK